MASVTDAYRWPHKLEHFRVGNPVRASIVWIWTKNRRFTHRLKQRIWRLHQRWMEKYFSLRPYRARKVGSVWSQCDWEWCHVWCLRHVATVMQHIGTGELYVGLDDSPVRYESYFRTFFLATVYRVEWQESTVWYEYWFWNRKSIITALQTTAMLTMYHGDPPPFNMFVKPEPITQTELIRIWHVISYSTRQ